jgi:hypothetical protein
VISSGDLPWESFRLYAFEWGPRVRMRGSRGGLGQADGAGMEQHPEPVVLEGAKPCPQQGPFCRSALRSRDDGGASAAWVNPSATYRSLLEREESEKESVRRAMPMPTRGPGWGEQGNSQRRGRR